MHWGLQERSATNSLFISKAGIPAGIGESLFESAKMSSVPPTCMYRLMRQKQNNLTLSQNFCEFSALGIITDISITSRGQGCKIMQLQVCVGGYDPEGQH